MFAGWLRKKYEPIHADRGPTIPAYRGPRFSPDPSRQTLPHERGAVRHVDLPRAAQDITTEHAMLKLTATVGIATAFLAQPISAQAAAVSSKMAGRVRSEALAERKLADAQAALQREKQEARQASAEADQAKANARAARESEETAKRKLADAEEAKIAAEGREQACERAANTEPGLGARLRSWFELGQPEGTSH